MSDLIKTILNNIAAWLANIAGWFWWLYINTQGDIFWGWTSMLWRILADVFDELSFAFILFRDWLMNVANEIATFLDARSILDLLFIPIKWALDAWAWVELAWTNVWQIVNAWWGTMSSTVQGWIDVAKEFLEELINMAQVGVNLLMGWVDSFSNITLPTLATWTGVTGLIDDFLTDHIIPFFATWSGVGDLIESAIKSWFPFYDELVSLWSEIQEFFTDPPQYVYNKLDEFFERFW